MTTPAMKTIVLPALKNHSATCIILHGLGDTGMGWKDVAEMLQAQHQHVKFVLPSAPVRPITLNFGMSMPGWYDIKGLSERSEEDCEGLDQAKDTVFDLIQGEMNNGLDANRIVCMGFSQGGAVSLYSAFQFPHTLAGVIGLSCYLPRPDHLESNLHEANRKTPLLMCHGDADPLVKPDWGRLSFEKLTKDWNIPGEWKTYAGMGHSACPEEIRDISSWFSKFVQ